MNSYKKVAGFLILLVLVACSSTQTETWKTSYRTSQVIEKLAVLANTGSLKTKQSFEAEMVARLQKENINAIEAYKLLPPQRRKAKVQDIIGKLYQEDVDVVMVVGVSDITRSSSYVHGNYRIQPRTYYNRFGDYYAHSYRRVHTPGHVRNSATLFLETTLYHLENQELIWTSETKTTDPANLKSYSRSYAKSIVKALDHDQII